MRHGRPGCGAARRVPPCRGRARGDLRPGAVVSGCARCRRWIASSSTCG